MTIQDQRSDAHGHSGWLIPLAILFAILLLSGLFLGWYLRPGPKVAQATDKANAVALTVGGQAFAIPANYIETPAARNGGEQASVTLAALFPSWQGFSDADARQFAGNAPDQPVIHLTLRSNSNALSAADRLARIYLPSVTNETGAAGPFELTQYGFRNDSGYGRNDLFVGRGAATPVLLLCEMEAPDLPSPNCIAVERPIAKGLSLSYRFKRAYLARWREMATGAQALVHKFETSD
jgi:hypothetical protein